VRNAQLAPPAPNAPGAASVRLDDGEIGSFNWDDKLTLEFSGAAAKARSVEIEAASVPRVFVLGDSTVADQGEGDYASWGQMLPRFFGPDIAIANHAQSGHSLKTFLTSLRLEKALSQMRPGDWALIQFGHNDQKQQWPQSYAPAETTYRDYLRVYVAEIRRRGARPILVTPVNRRTFDARGRIENSLGAYPDAVRAVAREEDLPLIDLNAMSAAFYEALGPERARLAFAQHGNDATHHNGYGAYEMARCIVSAIRAQELPLARYLRPGIASFDPALPDPPETFDLPSGAGRIAD
jgi:lysophospholipase L1-like esterase